MSFYTTQPQASYLIVTAWRTAAETYSKYLSSLVSITLL